ncbi:serine/threonine-protein kinase [Streptomyces meridianus]|uniref:non-specific serine/threonine protein kinase n=1 Tax=Streptomyces meridianus TaxID=2938945 RepID=A0ABT0X101_9ACTN|nr:serine/threonine-protein kinase [Streptomyces meridianus]MCM2575970.1 serine/threonine-protein kinase PknG [Streptomyces meridianus]
MTSSCGRPGCDGARATAGNDPDCADCAPAVPGGALSTDGFLGPAPTGVTASAAPRAGGRTVPDPRLPPDGSFVGTSRTLGSRRSVPGRMPRSESPVRSVRVRPATSSGWAPGRGRLGAGLVTVPEVPQADPRTAVSADPRVPEHRRFCGRADCGARVGRSRGGRPGRTEGFCTRCGHPYSFVPKLHAGDLVHEQYEVVGCLAHGGQGWIHLAVDHAVSDRWVVLKGLPGTADDDALAVAVPVLRHLAEIEHPNIVRIHNFVEHPDPRTGSLDGYIVMEYIGGRSLREIANERTTADRGRRAPLPVEQACAYGLEALEALGHLHSRNLLYCDFKPDNAIQQQDRLKLIDMGAVRRIDDTGGPVHGTAGYQAPEVAVLGPSVASDLYTVARTIAVLVFDFQGFTTVYADSLPPPEHIDVFNEYESLYRFLVRATDPDPTRRFASAGEMAEQLTGVLREVVALRTGQPRPALSALFGPELGCPAADPFPGPAGWRPDAGPVRAALAPVAATALALPVPHPDPDDPCAGFLAGLAAPAPRGMLTALASAPADSAERRLREARALLETGDPQAAAGALKAAEATNDGDWRVVWYRGVVALAAGDAEGAAWAFDAVYDAFPGETAPKLALAVCAELLGQADNAAEYYRSVWTTDPGFVSAAFGLARVRLAVGDRTGAVLALESVPEASVHSTAARMATVRARLTGDGGAPAGPDDLVAAAWQVERLRDLGLDAVRREQLTVEVLSAALAGVQTGEARRAVHGISGAGDGNRPGVGASLLGSRPDERGLRLGLERSYRALARLAQRGEERIDLVERANRCRPRTWM